MPESTIKLLLDEDVWQGLARALGEAGYDVISATEPQYKGLSDKEILAEAVAQGRAVITHNIRDFAPLAALCYEHGIEHPGIIVSKRFEKGRLLERVLALLSSVTAESLANTLRFT